jgi:ABC-2 type transport system permease protein
MISGLRYYAAIYRQFVAMCFAEATSYRLHFVLLIMMDLLFYASTFLTVSFIYDHIGVFSGWQREHFLFFVAFMLAVDQLHMTFVSENFWGFSEDVRTGNLDFVLLKPASPVFTIFFRIMRPGSLCLLPVPWACLIYFGSGFNLSVLSWLFLPLMVLLGFALMVSLEVLVSMSTLWLVESTGVNFLRMQFQNVSRWPDFAYLRFFRRVFTFILPVLLVGSAPVKFVFDPSQWQGMVWMVSYTVLACILIERIWRAGLRGYESASS